MSEDTATQAFLRQNRRFWWILPLLVLVLILLALAFILPGGGNGRGLKPFRPSRTPGELNVSSETAVVTFTDLNAAPEAYRDQRIRVTGDYQRLTPPVCRPYSGPIFSWSLVAEELQLNATGFESLLRNMPDGTTLTVEGIWRLYDGALGCGKEPPDGIAWYLAVERIISPNPLPNFVATPRATAVPDLSGESLSSPTPAADAPTEETATPTPPTATTPLGTITPGLTGTPTPTTTPTAGPGTVFPSVTPVSATPTNLPPGFPSPTPTLPVGGSPTPTLPAGGGTPVATTPPLPTSPSYPGATVTPTPTLTPDPY